MDDGNGNLRWPTWDEVANLCWLVLFGWLEYGNLFLQQIVLMMGKNFQQKRRNGRSSLKDIFLIPIVSILLVILIVVVASSTFEFPPAVYGIIPATPPLTSTPGGIFYKNGTRNRPYNSGNDAFYTLFYSPNTHAGVNTLMQNLGAQYNLNLNIVGYATATDVDNAFAVNLFNVWSGVKFDLTPFQVESGLFINNSATSNPVSYTISMNPQTNGGTGGFSVAYTTFDTKVYNDYEPTAEAWMWTGYLTLQNYIRTQITLQVNDVPKNFQVQTFAQRYPSSPIYPNTQVFSLTDARYFIWKWICPIALSICITLPALLFYVETVREREAKIKDLLEISGMMTISYWFGYLVSVVFAVLPTIVIIIAIATKTGILLPEEFGPYVLLLLCALLDQACASFAMGYVIYKSEYYAFPIFMLNIGCAVGGLFIAQSKEISIGGKLVLGGILPSAGISIGVFFIEAWVWDYPGIAIDINYVDDFHNLPSLQSTASVMVLFALIYMMIVLGMPFDFLRSTSKESVENIVVDFGIDQYKVDVQPNEIEGEVLLKVENLNHVYADGTHAVKNVNFEVREGEILSFLGSNGAGKSTTMGMLSGTLKATVGDATVNGYSITSETTKARRCLGICTQQDVLWPDITIAEHLWLFGLLRGTKISEMQRNVDEMMANLGFPEKRNFVCSQLSGGQRRRCCVGISMIGSNKVVYLDEPTAGLDPVARRQLWDLVNKNRKGRAILLTTHFMDEADVLGDRIAIVKEGRLRCVGNARFLKQLFGVGYLLRCALAADINSDAVDSIMKLVTMYVAEGASIVSKAGTELSIRLPKSAVGAFPMLFEQLETVGKSSLGVNTFGIETTTLEEVFIRVVNEDEVESYRNVDESNMLIGAASGAARDLVEQRVNKRIEEKNPLSEEDVALILTKGKAQDVCCTCLLVCSQSYHLIKKRYHQFTRSKGQFFMGVFIPLVIGALICYVISTTPTEALGGPNPINPMEYQEYIPPSLLVSTLFAGSDRNEILAESSFGPVTKVGNNYTKIYDYVKAKSQPPYRGINSTEGLVYGNMSFAFSNVTVMYNASYPINLGAAVSYVLNSAIKTVSKGKVTFSEICQPFPYSQLGGQSNGFQFTGWLMGFFTGTLGASVSVVLGGERVGGVKHLQMASGTSVVSYWVANVVWDVFMLFCVVFLFSMGLGISDPEYYFYNGGFGVLLIGGICWILATIVRFYVASFYLASVQMAQTAFFTGSFVSMFVVMTIFGNVLFSKGINGDISSSGAQGISVFLTIIEPTFGYTMLILYQHNLLSARSQNGMANALSIRIAGLFTLCQFITFGVGFILVLFMEWRCSCGVAKAPPEEEVLVEEGTYESTPQIVGLPQYRRYKDHDPDVTEEKKIVQDLLASRKINSSRNAIFIHGARKVYLARGVQPSKVAVRDMNLTVPRGEIFGLLGANGAGKTTLLKIVSGLEMPTTGKVLINGHDIIYSTARAQRNMGLCPQFDTLVERLTVLENLYLFGNIKGIPGRRMQSVVDAIMKALQIARYKHKLIMQLSGGNRRKVSLAVALIGSPPTLYLDEPSTGLDPVASRLMWRLLNKVADSKTQSVVLTTHNMLECESVCTRIGIMKSGELVCLGNSQHLRSTHGTGFLLEMTLEESQVINEVTREQQYVKEAKDFVSQMFPDSVVIDEHSTMVNWEINKSSMRKLSETFQILEEAKTSLHIIDYSMSQSTLEQVFLKKIRPDQQDFVDEAEQQTIQISPNPADYFEAYCCLALACFFPGAHRCLLGQFWTGCLFFWTWNELAMGWILDVFDTHIMVQQRIAETGKHIHCLLWLCSCFVCCANCCINFWCCCCICCGLMKRPGLRSPQTTQDGIHESVVRPTVMQQEMVGYPQVYTEQPVNSNYDQRTYSTHQNTSDPFASTSSNPMVPTVVVASTAETQRGVHGGYGGPSSVSLLEASSSRV